LEERSNRIEDNFEQLEVLRVQDSEEYNLVKIKLETDVQVLEQQLQQVYLYRFTVDESYLST
jgi:dynein regulatory complex protein 1